MQGVTIIERAFQLADECGSLGQVRNRLKREGYFDVEAHLGGRQIQREINERLYAKLSASRNRLTMASGE